MSPVGCSEAMGAPGPDTVAKAPEVGKAGVPDTVTRVGSEALALGAAEEPVARGDEGAPEERVQAEVEEVGVAPEVPDGRVPEGGGT